MQREVSKYCPLVKADCLQWGCTFFTKLVGTHPQTGQHVEEWDCCIKWLPLLLTENSQQGRSTAAAVESFRNEMVKANTQLLQLDSK